jgi:acetyl-CoA carboxylase carboxyltransferase component
MCARSLGADFTAAWPTAEIAVMGPEGAANIIFRSEIEKAEKPAEFRKQKEAEYKSMFATPYPAAARGFVDVVLTPRDSRPVLIQALQSLASKRESRPAKKHGNLPV